MLKPMLARGELHCIGATTLDEYRKHIEKDAALERRFQPVFVGEPTRRGHHLASCAACASATSSTTRCASRTPRWWPRRCCRTATSPTASCPTRRSTWWTRPRLEAAHGSDQHAGRAGRGRAAASCSSRSSARASARRRTRPRRSGWSASSRSWPSLKEQAGAAGGAAGRPSWSS